MYSNHHDYIDMKHFNKYIFGSVALLVIATGFASCKTRKMIYLNLLRLNDLNKQKQRITVFYVLPRTDG